MELKSSLARYLLKRLSYNWRRASHYHTYNIKANDCFKGQR